MAQGQSLRGDDASPHLNSDEDEEEEPRRPVTKKVKVHWQETLITLIPTQQEQIAELSRNSKMAAVPTPSSSPVQGSCAQVTTTLNTSFRLSEFNPGTSNYAIDEWLKDATKLKGELGVSDMIMIAKAGEASEVEGTVIIVIGVQYAVHGTTFVMTLLLLFLTGRLLVFVLLTQRHYEAETLSDYSIQKLQCIRRICNLLPWTTILRMTEYGFDHSEAQASIRIQQRVPSAICKNFLTSSTHAGVDLGRCPVRALIALQVLRQAHPTGSEKCQICRFKAYVFNVGNMVVVKMIAVPETKRMLSGQSGKRLMK